MDQNAIIILYDIHICYFSLSLSLTFSHCDSCLSMPTTHLCSEIIGMAQNFAGVLGVGEDLHHIKTVLRSCNDYPFCNKTSSLLIRGSYILVLKNRPSHQSISKSCCPSQGALHNNYS